MSANLRHDQADNHATPEPTMFPAAGDTPTTAPEAPARELPLVAREAALDAVERALAATVRLQRKLPLPPAPQLNESDERPRRGAAFEGDVRRLRPRAPLEPVAMAVPPVEEERASAGVLVAKVISAIAVASAAGLFAVGVLPLPFSVNSTASPQRAVADAPSPEARQQLAAPTMPIAPPTAEVAVARSPERAALVERFVALRQQAEQQQAAEPIAPQAVKAVRVTMPTAQQVRALDREEITGLYDRSQALVEQGDIVSARLMLTRAAEAGDARSAFALGTTYDPDVLNKLRVIGIAPDPAQAQVWYSKAAELGSPEAALRLEKLAGR